MSFDADEEILQDFLVEAGEILEQLSEQLVELENSPDDVDLLNAIFRGFHTVKGGAGFLQLDALVALCHIAENVFDHLRNGKISVSAELMDIVLQALDTVNEMFAAVHQRAELVPAEKSLLDALTSLIENGGNKAIPPPPVESAPVESAPVVEAPVSSPVSPDASSNDTSANDTRANEVKSDAQPSGDITDEEFEQFLDALEEPKTNGPTAAAESSDDVDLFGADSEEAPTKPTADDILNSASTEEITEDEFDAILDQLHGSGKSPEAASAATSSSPKATSNESDEFSDDEFESLLDDLHGKGKHSGAPEGGTTNNVTSQSPAKAESTAGATDGAISDDEFENLLDELHGKGQGPTAIEDGAPAAAPVTATPAPVAAAPAPAPVAAAPVPPAAKPATPIPAPASAKSAKPKPAVADKGKAAATKELGAVAAETTVRVDTKRLDDIMNMVGELVLVRNRLVRLGLKSADEAMGKAVANLDVVTADLQTSVMKTRMQPIKKVFGRFPRVVRDLARNLKKEINLELQGEETDLDKNLVEALADPLVHLVRNSVDHGVETPDIREAAGKSRAGRIVLAAQQEGDHIVLSITDDGAGMEAEMLRQRAVAKGIMDEETAERLSDQESFNLIFHPGFSTKDEISDVSGRGVGMDVVKTKITQLNGSVNVQSARGKGTVISIKVPLTLAIMPTLMVMLGQQTFALPLVSVNEIFHMDLNKTSVVDGQEVVIVREKALPLFHLKKWLVCKPADNKSIATAHVVIVTVGTQKVGFVVDQLIGQEEVVIKPLGRMLHGTAGMAGATITGDGRIALILDVPSMLNKYVGAVG